MKIGLRTIDRSVTFWMGLALFVVSPSCYSRAKAAGASRGAPFCGVVDPRPAPAEGAVDAPRDVAAEVPGPGVGHALRTRAGRPARL